jgi:phosphatidylserine/phosphatidylglycerophosphate/cardiolipin synthase-like enzyme
MTNQIITDAQFINAAISVARRAEHHLLLVQYLFIIDRTPSHPAPRIAEELMQAAKRGVKVRILMNRFSHGRAASTPAARRPIELQHSNIDLRWHTRGQVLHSKIIVRDEEELLIGSHNLSHWGLTRSHNLSLLTNDRTSALAVLWIYNPMFDRAKHA